MIELSSLRVYQQYLYGSIINNTKEKLFEKKNFINKSDLYNFKNEEIKKPNKNVNIKKFILGKYKKNKRKINKKEYKGFCNCIKTNCFQNYCICKLFNKNCNNKCNCINCINFTKYIN